MGIIKNTLRLAGSLVMLGATGFGYMYSTDEGFRRSMFFWSKMGPLYVEYRLMQKRTAHLPVKERAVFFQPLHEKYAPIVLQSILELRGFFIKIGQVASTRSDFLPPEFLDTLGTLQDQVPPEPLALIKAIYEQSTGSSMDDDFTNISPEPLGSASIGQVHSAKRMIDGKDVVIKIMYPDAEKFFKTDISTMKLFTKIAQPEHLPVLEEIEKQFVTEFDYEGEASNLQRVHDNLMPVWGQKVIVPKPLFATKHVLVMEKIDGIRLVDGIKHHFKRIATMRGMTVDQMQAELEDMKAEGKVIAPPSVQQLRQLEWWSWLHSLPQQIYHTFVPNEQELKEEDDSNFPDQLLDIEQILTDLFQVHGHQIFVDGLFNGDPHPGNIMLAKDGRIGLIDFGQVKELTLEQRVMFARLVVALRLGDAREAARVYQEGGFKTKHMDEEVTAGHAFVILNNDDCETTLKGVNIQVFLEELQAMDPVVEMGQDNILASRVALLLRGLGYALNYRIRSCDAWFDQARHLLEEQGVEVPEPVTEEEIFIPPGKDPWQREPSDSMFLKIVNRVRDRVFGSLSK